MNKYIVRTEEKRTVYFVSEYIVFAESESEAKQKVIDDSYDIDMLDSWDTESDDYEFLNVENWDVIKQEEITNSIFDFSYKYVGPNSVLQRNKYKIINVFDDKEYVLCEIIGTPRTNPIQIIRFKNLKKIERLK